MRILKVCEHNIFQITALISPNLQLGAVEYKHELIRYKVKTQKVTVQGYNENKYGQKSVCEHNVL